MTDTITFPARDWGDTEQAPAPVPLVLVSSRDGRGDPVEVPGKSAAWRGVAKKATAAGWEARITYALAWTADRYYLNGNLAKAAHHTHSVAVRLTRRDAKAFGVWTRDTTLPDVPLAGWSWLHGFATGVAGKLGLEPFKGVVS